MSIAANSPRRRPHTILGGAAALLAVFASSLTAERGKAAPTQSTLIANARLIDGSGAPERRASVRIRGGRILAVGDLKPRAGEKVVDGRGQVLSPGFIDTHSHHEHGLF